MPAGIRLLATLLAALVLAAPTLRAQDAVYRLESGDVVEIWTAQEPSLNRQVIVRPDGRVSLPLAGHLQARGLSLEELERAILERLAAYYRTPLDLVAILHPPEVADPPTIYVAGTVTTPGAYRHRPGMTVLHALSVAGGLLRPAALDDAATLVEAQRTVRVLRRQLAIVVAQEARLLAESRGNAAIAVEPGDEERLRRSGLGGALDEALAQERRLMDLRAEELEEDIAAAERALALAREELALSEAEAQASDAQLAVVEEESVAMETLVARGIVTETRAREMRIRRAELVRGRHQLEAALARARGETKRAEADLLAVRTRRTLERSAELHELQRRREELEINLSAGERALADLGLPSATDFEPTVRFTILRSVDGTMRELPAQDMTEVRAGDLVNVVRIDPDTRSPAAARERALAEALALGETRTLGETRR